jgi:uncharacterized membrane protein
MNWYYVVKGQQQGPVTVDAIQGLIQDGTLVPSDYVWNEQMGSAWKRITEVPELNAAQAAAGAPPGQPVATTFGAAEVVPNGQLMRKAKQALSGSWGTAIGVIVVAGLLSGIVNTIPFIGWLLGLIIAGPFMLGLALFFLGLCRGETAFSRLFDGFRNFGTALAAYLLMVLLLLGWYLLLIVPGIYKTYAYWMTFYVVADNPGISPLDAITRSRQLMKGRKWKLFCLQMRYTGLALLVWLPFLLGAVLALLASKWIAAAVIAGIGLFVMMLAALFWLGPWEKTAETLFYEDVGRQ